MRMEIESYMHRCNTTDVETGCHWSLWWTDNSSNFDMSKSEGQGTEEDETGMEGVGWEGIRGWGTTRVGMTRGASWASSGSSLAIAVAMWLLLLERKSWSNGCSGVRVLRGKVQLVELEDLSQDHPIRKIFLIEIEGKYVIKQTWKVERIVSDYAINYKKNTPACVAEITGFGHDVVMNDSSKDLCQR